jgi:hypothetical protein
MITRLSRWMAVFGVRPAYSVGCGDWKGAFLGRKKLWKTGILHGLRFRISDS